MTQVEIRACWLEAKEAYLSVMPELDVPFPDLVILTGPTWERKRADTVERLQSNHIRSIPDFVRRCRWFAYVI